MATDPLLNLPEYRVKTLMDFVHTFIKTTRRGKSVPMTNKAKKLEDAVKGVVELDVPKLYFDSMRYEVLVGITLKAVHAPLSLNIEEAALVRHLQAGGLDIKTIADVSAIIDNMACWPSNE